VKNQKSNSIGSGVQHHILPGYDQAMWHQLSGYPEYF